MTMRLVKYNNTIVRLVRYSESVLFSTDKDWLLLEYDIHLPEHKRHNRKWVSLSTRFEWIKEFIL